MKSPVAAAPVVAFEKRRPRVAVVVLNWNGLTDTIPCIESLLAVRYAPLDILVVDNASSGDDVERLRARFGTRIRIVVSPTNRGFSGGNNLGIRYAKEILHADHVLLLNNDTVVDPGFVDALVTEAEARPDAGVLASKMYYHDVPDQIWYAGGWFHMFGFHGHRRQGERDDGRHEETVETDYAPFASVLITGTALKRVGVLPEDYFFLWEDLDYCTEARMEGLKCYYVPASRIWHKVGRSSSEGEWAYRKLWHGMRGRIMLRRRLLSRPLYWAYLALFACVLAPLHAASYLFLKGDPRRVSAMLSGAWAGARGKPPPELRPAAGSPLGSEEAGAPQASAEGPLVRALVATVLAGALLLLFASIRVYGAVDPALGYGLLFVAGAAAVVLVLRVRDGSVRSFLPLLVLFSALCSFSILTTDRIFGIDAPFGYASARAISTRGWPLPPDLTASSVGTYAAFPILDFAAILFQGVSGLPLESVMRLLPLLLAPATFFLFLAVGFAVTRNRFAVAGGALALALTFNVFSFQRWYVREAVGFPLFLLAIWAFLRIFRTPEGGAAAAPKDGRFLLVFALAGGSTALAHHLSSLSLLILLASLSAAFLIVGGDAYRRRGKLAIGLTLGLAVGLLAYWLVGQVEALQESLLGALRSIVTFDFSNEIARSNYRPITEAPLRLVVLLIVNAVIAGVLTVGVVRAVAKRELRKTVPLALFVGGIVLVLLARSTLYLGGIYVAFYRALSFVWPFLFIAFFLAVAASPKGRRVAAAMLVAFVAANVAMVPDYYFDHSIRGKDAFTDHRNVFGEALVTANAWAGFGNRFLVGDDITTVYLRGVGDHAIEDLSAFYQGNQTDRARYHFMLLGDAALDSPPPWVKGEGNASTSAFGPLLDHDTALALVYSTGEWHAYRLLNGNGPGPREPVAT